MIYRERILAGKLHQMLRRFPVVVVSGARQVGKSTLLRHELPTWEMVVFDSATDVGNARQDPDLFLDNHPSPLILDEIQYAPELIAALKRRVDRTVPPARGMAESVGRRAGQYVLTGSQQWSVLKTATESLAGRAVFLDMQSFCLAEIAAPTAGDHWLKRYLDAPEAFVASPGGRLETTRSVNEQIWRGFLPEANALDLDWLPDFHRAYMRTYIERDARLLADVGDWQQFGRFVQIAAALTAQEINHSKLGRELGITPQTAQRWLATLRGTFQWLEIPAYHGNTIKRVSSKHKGYLADTGLACTLQAISSPRVLSGHPLAGPLFETAVVAEINKLSESLIVRPMLHHWRSHGGAEVDALMERDGVFYPIEVKLGSRPSRQDARGVDAFRETYPKLEVAPGLVIAPTGQMAKLCDGAYALPWDSR